jgi:quercetin dioxygenase-like cupin family protein
VQVEHRVEEGDPPAEILRLAESVHCDLIVMGTQGRTGLSRWLAGSVAEEVLRKSSCAVLAVKSPPFTPVRHAEPAEVVDVRPFGKEISIATTKVLVKTKDVEVLRMVVPAGKEIPTHQTPGSIIVHCLEGRIEFHALGKIQTLEPGQMFFLPKNEAHSVKGLEDASLLVTILLTR